MTVYDFKTKTLDKFGFKIPFIKKEHPYFIDQYNGGINMKGKVEKAIVFKDGAYEGKIIGLEHRTEPYDYIDIVVEEKETQLKLKVGYPNTLTENSGLGQCLLRFGAKLKIGEEIEYEDFLEKDKKVSFLVQMKETPKGNFANIIQNSLRPL